MICGARSIAGGSVGDAVAALKGKFGGFRKKQPASPTGDPAQFTVPVAPAVAHRIPHNPVAVTGPADASGAADAVAQATACLAAPGIPPVTVGAPGPGRAVGAGWSPVTWKTPSRIPPATSGNRAAPSSSRFGPLPGVFWPPPAPTAPERRTRSGWRLRPPRPESGPAMPTPTRWIWCTPGSTNRSSPGILSPSPQTSTGRSLTWTDLRSLCWTACLPKPPHQRPAVSRPTARKPR